MSSGKIARAVVGISLCGLGFWLALPKPYHEKTYLIDAEGCLLETAIVEKQEGAAQGSVLLFHGISANKKIMSYVADGFAEQGLRVYVPDLPGHGRTPGPFSPGRAEQCAESLLRDLLARGMISADRTILAGHSMGGAIAIRVATRVPVAGVIAISPAPMGTPYEISPEMVWFPRPDILPKRTLVVYGGLEPSSVRGATNHLVQALMYGRPAILELPRATHVSILFDPRAVRASQEWSAQTFGLSPTVALPSHRPIFGALAGFFGLLVLAGPFLREVTGKNRNKEETEPTSGISVSRALAEIGIGSILVVLLLRLWIPLQALHLFLGDYLASFLILLGVALVILHWRSVRQDFSGRFSRFLPAALTAIILFLLFTAWFNVSFYEAWLTVAKWARFPFLFVALLPYLIAEETMLGPVAAGGKWRRLAVALSLRLIAWGAIMGGVLILHNGEILMGLLALYMALFNLVQRSAMDLVRNETGSATATAIFGAILQAGFCLVIFPIT